MASARHAFPQGFMLQEYRIEDVLGAGAFGVTYRATDTNLGMSVAIKEFFPGQYAQRNLQGSMVAKSPEYEEFVRWGLDRFIAEGKILAQFKHPNIVRVSRYFQVLGTAFIVMDFEEGESLHNFIERAPDSIDEKRLRAVFEPILEGLHSVHEKQYLHRDVKPGNIYIRRNKSPLLLDFGAARLELGSPDDDTTVMFTPGYAPPEQYNTRAVQTAASDLYALGATIYRCIVLDKPVDAIERQKAQSAGMPDPLPSVVERGAGKFSQLLLETVDWMMRLDIRERPKSAQQVLAKLRGELMEKPEAVPVFSYRPDHQSRVYKLVFAGPVGAGKTTAIQVISDVATIRAESQTTDGMQDHKQHTTVAMDYGMMKLSPTETVQLYGTPGHERFAFMWKIVQKGALGLVLLIDNTAPDAFVRLEGFLDAFREMIEQTKIVVGLTRMDDQPRPTIEDYHKFLWSLDKSWCQNIPVMEVDARDRADVSILVKSLLVSVDPKLVI